MSVETPVITSIKKKYMAQEESLRNQFDRQKQDLEQQLRMTVDRYMNARRECATGNASSCQMVPALKNEMDRIEQDRKRLAIDELRALEELKRQRDAELAANKPNTFIDFGNVRMVG